MKYYSQYGQDQYVIDRLNHQQNGVFVDVGAAHPTQISNTYVLETKFGWQGLLVEADEQFIQQLQQHRSSTVISALVFNQDNLPVQYITTCEVGSGYGNHINGFGVPHSVKLGQKTLTTTTLQNILVDNNMPTVIDYLSVDVEGAELQVLQSVNLDKYTFRIITVEENNQFQQLQNLLTSHNYVLDHILQNPGLDEKELVFVHKELI